MKFALLLFACVLAGPLAARDANPASSSGPGPALSDEATPSAILSTMEKVADWQLSQPAGHRADHWTSGVLYAGVMALSDLAGKPKYHDAMLAVGRTNHWRPGGRIYHADDHCVSQMYLELYSQDRDPAMLAPTRERFDYILAHPATNGLCFTNKTASDRWSWCDALFMAPPVWARLSQATGDRRYLDFMDHEWRATSELLYDNQEHLFFRDSRYFSQREANGQKVFWSRGNGWVMGALARVLQVMPPDYPQRKFYERQYKEVAARIASLQQPDGLWRASLLDPASHPSKETSGSGFYVFALAWGINRGLLDPGVYKPVVRKGWQGLVRCVTPEGKLEYVQPVGENPRTFPPDSTDVYGVGAFLLAGGEMYRLPAGE
jgi:unsaturated rhamnogalacturonyl hydrolase